MANPSGTRYELAGCAKIGVVGFKFILSQGHDPEIGVVFPGTPAHSAGLLKGDVIISVDDVPMRGLSKEEICGMIIGAPDTIVRISIRRKQKTFSKAIKRMHFDDLARAHPAIGKDYEKSGVGDFTPH